MDQDVYFKFLEDKFLTYRELSSIVVQDNGEPMVALIPGDPVRIFAMDERMKKYTGNSIFVRETLVEKLCEAQTLLGRLKSDCFLEVVYGYRHLSIQRQMYEKIECDLRSKSHYANDEDIKEQIHHFVAVPEVSGHPTGGAIDIRILDAMGKPLDMGTEAHDFVKNSYVYAPFISKRAWHNRQCLRQCMTMAGFAPYDGEWWHFSYGDREWAKYYGKPCAIYDQVSFQESPLEEGNVV